jgi:cupin superfamily acireductone dioxygenase involved in methionine salvage
MTGSRLSKRFPMVGELMVPLPVSESYEAEAKAWRMVAEDLAKGYRNKDTIRLHGGLADFDELVEFYGEK